jgi:hypothetical protein
LPRPFALFLRFSEIGIARQFPPIPILRSQNFKKPKDIPHPRVSAGRIASGRQSELCAIGQKFDLRKGRINRSGRETSGADAIGRWAGEMPRQGHGCIREK